jgi:hypothetical protein
VTTETTPAPAAPPATTTEAPQGAPAAETPAADAPLKQNLGAKLQEALSPREKFQAAIAERRAAASGKAAPPAQAPPPVEQPPAAVAPPPAEPTKTPTADDLISKLTAITRADAELLARDRALREREERLKPLEQATSNPDLDARLRAVGLTFEQIQDFKLNGNQPTQEMRILQQLESYQREVNAMKERLEKQDKETQTAAANHARESYKSFVGGLAEKGGAEFELFRSFGDEAKELAAQRFEAYHRKHGALPDNTAILREVESHLEATRLAPLLKTERLKSKLSPVAPPPAVATPTSQPTGARNVSNAAVASSPPRPTKPNAAERRELIASAFKQRRSGG